MKCAEIQKKLSDGESLTDALRDHLDSCAECACFMTAISEIRRQVHTLDAPLLPEALDGETRDACREAVASFASAPAGIPLFMRIIFALVILGTAIWIGLSDPSILNGTEQSLSDMRVLFIVLQNGLMLIFAPLLIRRMRRDAVHH